MSDFYFNYLIWFIELFYFVIFYISIIVCLLITVAFFTLYERKLLGSIQQRVGPNKVGVLGLLQAIADAVKLFSKEVIMPIRANKALFIFAPLMSFFLSILGWIVIPFGTSVAVSNINVGIIIILLISAMNVYGIIIAGWSSNSHYAFIGALRSAAQAISYELAMSTNILNVVVAAGSLNLSEIVIAQKELWYVIPLFPTFILFFICCLAETNRSPFDLPEAESELVSGYNTEYSGLPFALFFLGEYVNILFLCNLMVLLFFGGWLTPSVFSIIPVINLIPDSWFHFCKVAVLISIFIWVRATLPRFRYDQLMVWGWKIILPLSFYTFGFTIICLIAFEGLPPIL